MGISSLPNRARVREIGGIFRENQKARFRCIGGSRGFRRYFGCCGVSVSRKDRSKNQTNDLGGSVYRVRSMFPVYLTKEANMSPGEVNVANVAMMKDMEEIAKLRYNEEDRLEAESKSGKLKPKWE